MEKDISQQTGQRKSFLLLYQRRIQYNFIGFERVIIMEKYEGNTQARTHTRNLWNGVHTIRNSEECFIPLGRADPIPRQSARQACIVY